MDLHYKSRKFPRRETQIGLLVMHRYFALSGRRSAPNLAMGKGWRSGHSPL